MGTNIKQDNIIIALKKSQSSRNENVIFCNYPHRHCLKHALKGYEFCINHIMEDKSAPYKQCCYIHHKTGKRCPNAAFKSEKKEGYCHEHRKKIIILRRQAMKNKSKSVESVESILHDLEKNLDSSKKSSESSTKAVPPKTISNLYETEDYISDSDSDKEPIPIEDIFKGDAESDAESLDSDQEDPLKHAGIYSAEEATLIMRDKLIRLQSLYIGQFKRLQHILRERRRKYLKSVKEEREIYGSIYHSSKSGSELQTYRKLRALNRYHCKRGEESLMQLQNKEKRLALTEGASYKPPVVTKCMNTEDGIRCTNSPLPLSKFCLKHILNDSQQVLFQPCRYADTGCNKVLVPFQEDARCKLHLSLSEAIEPLVKTLPQGSGSSPKGYPVMMSDIDKFLGDPDQFLSTLSSTTFQPSSESSNAYNQASNAIGESNAYGFQVPEPTNPNLNPTTTVAPITLKSEPDDSITIKKEIPSPSETEHSSMMNETFTKEKIKDTEGS